MSRVGKLSLWGVAVLLMLLSVIVNPGNRMIVLAQQPTGSVPTVTGTVAGPTVKVYSDLGQITVYAGPGSFAYPAIGILLANEYAPALGYARDHDDWIQIYYAGVPGSVGWVYAPYVSLSPGAFLPIIEVPSTPTPFSTPTLNPTLEAAFIGLQTPTRLPTFTPPPPLDLPSFTDINPTNNRSVPAGLIIFSLGLFGFFGAVISYLRDR